MTPQRKLCRANTRAAIVTMTFVVATLSCDASRTIRPGIIEADPVVQLLVTPKDITVQVGDSTDFQVLGLTASGDTAAVSVTWSSTSGNIKGSGKGKALGKYKADRPGKHKVIATDDSTGIADSSDVTVVESPVRTVTVSPADLVLEEGETATLTAEVRDSAGNVLTGYTVEWSSSNGSVASVSNSGRVTARAAGAATITASTDGRSGTAAITVNGTPPPPPDPNALPVFPGAEGYGTTTAAGRGGAILRVTTLAEFGPGSLHEALVNTSGPRTIIFDVSGTIVGTSSSEWEVDAGNVTVAGQTAPSPGITLRNIMLSIEASDVLIQHIRLRVGDDPSGPDPGRRNAFQVVGPIANVVIDHVSTSWAIDENTSVYPSGDAAPTNVTISNSIISEALSNSLHPDGEHSMGLLIGQTSTSIAVIGNLFAHNNFRNPMGKGGTELLYLNNYIYNPGSNEVLVLTGDQGPTYTSIIGNAGRRGPSTEDLDEGVRVRVYGDTDDGSQIYVTDNQLEADPYASSNPSSIFVASPPRALPNPLTIRPGSTVQAYVTSNAGARPADRDAVDLRVVDDVINGTGRIIDSQSEVGGWPTLAQNTRVLALPASPNGDDDGDGYTNLEELLHQLAAEVEGRSP